MCGLFGSITKSNVTLTPEQKDMRARALSAMAIAMQDRGTDSTGIAVIKDHKYQLHKRNTPAQQFVNDKKFKTIVRDDFTIAIGHTRLATVGDKTSKNAHPFKKGSIIGSHNGFVSNWQTINDKVEVDSEVIFQLLNENKNDYKKAFSELYGNFAISWTDLNTPNTMFLGVEDNPIYVVRVSEIGTIFWLSEEIYLQTVIEGIFGLNNREVWKCGKDYTYKIDPELKITKQKAEFKNWSYSSGYRSGAGDFDDDTPYDSGYITRTDADNRPDSSFRQIGDGIKRIEGKKSSQKVIEIIGEDDYSQKDNELYFLLFDGVCTNCKEDIHAEDGIWLNYYDNKMLCVSCGTGIKVINKDYCYLDEDTYFQELGELEQIYKENHATI